MTTTTAEAQSGLRSRKKAAARAALVDATGSLVDDGLAVDDITMTIVADLAGVSQRTVFRYFDTKHDLLLAVCSIEPLDVEDRPAIDIDRVARVLASDPTFLGAMVNLLGLGWSIDRTRLRRAMDCTLELVAAAQAARDDGTWSRP